ncbi:MAG: DNA alkylation repair protein [Candidatus Cloacimonadaceae bacterium]
MHINDAKVYKSILQLALDYLSQRANPANVIKYSRYFKEGYDAWGCGETDVKDVSTLIEQKYPELTIAQVIELGSLLFKHGKYEMGSVALILISRRVKDYDKATFQGLKGLFDHGVGNWAHSDYLCSQVTPPFILKGIIDYHDLQDWLQSVSRWTRRAVPVTLLCIRKTEKPEPLLKLIEPLMLDPERVVHQGTGWFLRELWKIHPAPVEDLLYKYRNTAARLIIQYATEKMSKEQKERFRKEKKK